MKLHPLFRYYVFVRNDSWEQGQPCSEYDRMKHFAELMGVCDSLNFNKSILTSRSWKSYCSFTDCFAAKG